MRLLAASSKKGWQLWRTCTTLTSSSLSRPSSHILSPSHITLRNFTTTPQPAGSFTNPVKANVTLEQIAQNIAEELNTKKDPRTLLKRAVLHAVQGNKDLSHTDIQAALASDSSPIMKEDAIGIALSCGLIGLAQQIIDGLINELGDKINPKALLALSIADEISNEKFMDYSSRFLRIVGNDPQYETDITILHAGRASTLTQLLKLDEAMLEAEKVKARPPVPRDHQRFSYLRECKWNMLVCEVTKNKSEELCQFAIDTLFDYNDFKKPPGSSQLIANRMLFFRDAVLQDKTRIPEVVQKLTDLIIRNPEAHQFWVSVALMARKELTENDEVTRAKESYRALISHRNAYSLHGLRDLTGDRLALDPDARIDRIQLMLKDVAQLLQSGLEPPGPDKYNFWINIAYVSYALNDFNAALIYSMLGLKMSVPTSTDKHVFHRVISTAHLMQGSFKQAVKYDFGSETDHLHLIVLAAAYVFMGGAENESKATELLTILTTSKDSPCKLMHPSEQIAIFQKHRDIIKAEEIFGVDEREMQTMWHSTNLASSDLISKQECIEHADKVLTWPGMTNPLLALFRYDTINRKAVAHFTLNNYEKALENFLIVQKEYPCIARYVDILFCYFKLGREQEADEIYDNMLRAVSPKQHDLFLSEIVSVLLYSELYKNIDKSYKYLDKYHDKSSRVWLELKVDACKLSNRKEEELEYLNKLAVHPEADKALVQVLRGHVLVALGKAEEGIQAFESSVDDPKEGGTAMLALARHYENVPDYAKALQMYVKLVDKLPIEAHEGSALCLLRMELPDLALEQINNAFSYNKPEEPNPWGTMLRANILATLNRSEEALVDFNAVVVMSKGNFLEAEAYFSRGKLYCIIGDNAKAETDFQKALELDPNYEGPIQNFISIIEVNQNASPVEETEEENTPKN